MLIGFLITCTKRTDVMGRDDDPTIDLKDMAYKEELAFQLKLRPNGDRRMIEAQTREKIYGPKKMGRGGNLCRGMGKTSKGGNYRFV